MQAGDVVQKRYVLEEPLGSGGMAEVWRARDRRLQRPVAVKFLTSSLAGDPEFLVRFFAEAQAVARLTHPNVVAVWDFGQHEGRPFLVMEYVGGGSLAAWRGRRMEPRRALQIVREAARGAGAAHRAEVVHRDIKPGNILVDDDGRIKLADFGIASSSNVEHLTGTGAVVGSPHYLSPEQVAGDRIQPASDVYSLGIVLYELLTGRRPFDGSHVTRIALARIDEDPPPPRALVAELDPAVEDLVLHCLARFASARPPTGDALAAAIDAANAAVDTAALPDPVPLPRRRPVLVAAALVAAAVVSATLYTRANDGAVAGPGPGRPTDATERGESTAP